MTSVAPWRSGAAHGRAHAATEAANPRSAGPHQARHLLLSRVDVLGGEFGMRRWRPVGAARSRPGCGGHAPGPPFGDGTPGNPVV